MEYQASVADDAPTEDSAAAARPAPGKQTLSGRLPARPRPIGKPMPVQRQAGPGPAANGSDAHEDPFAAHLIESPQPPQQGDEPSDTARAAGSEESDPVELGVAYLRQRWAAYRSNHVMQSRLSYWANYYARLSNESLGREMARNASPKLSHVGTRDLAISIVREEMAQDLQSELALDPIEGARHLTQAEAAGFGLIRTIEPSFEPEHARMIDAVATGFEERVYDRMRPILARARGGVNEATFQPIANQLANEALAPYHGTMQELTIAVRAAFRRAVKDVVVSTGDHVMAICFIRAMSDVMVAHADDTSHRAQTADAALTLQVALAGNDKTNTRDLLEVNAAVIAASMERDDLVELDLARNVIEVQYIKLYVALKQALQEVADDWIAARTKDFHDEAAVIARDKLWISRGINMAWSFCPGPVAAVPVVLLGTISDIFSDALMSTVQSQISERERAIRARVGELLRERLTDIEEVARDQFSKLDAGALPRLRERTFLSISAIAAGYASSLRRALAGS